MKVAVVGTGYVGLVTAVVLAHLGNDVTCVDKDTHKLALIEKAESPIYEPGIEEMLERSLREGFLKTSTSAAEATKQSDIVFIAVGTPPGADGTPDLTAVRAVAKDIAAGIKKYTVVVNKSTVPVGSGELVANIIREFGVSDDLFDVVSNPEFLREGSAIRDTLEPDRVVIGAKSEAAAAKLVELYKPLNAKVYVTDLNSAELIKYASNSFLALKISYINAISRICELCGADISAVAEGMGADKRIGAAFLQAGLGWGGSCFPKDVLGMISTSERFGYDFELLREVVEINDDQTQHFLDRVEKYLGTFEGKKVGLLGLAFKPNTDDIRDAKSLVIIERILKSGGTVQAFDPVAEENVRKIYPDITYSKSIYEVAEGVDVLLLVTEWNEFRQIDLVKLRGKMVGKGLFDGRRIYSPAAAAAAGFDYFTIGSK